MYYWICEDWDPTTTPYGEPGPGTCRLYDPLTDEDIRWSAPYPYQLRCHTHPRRQARRYETWPGWARRFRTARDRYWDYDPRERTFVLRVFVATARSLWLETTPVTR